MGDGPVRGANSRLPQRDSRTLGQAVVLSPESSYGLDARCIPADDHDACETTSRPAPSPSSSPTSRVDAAAARARRRGIRGGARRAPPRAARGVRAPRRGRGGHAGGRLLRRLPDRAGRSSMRRPRRRRRLASGPIRVRMGLHTGTPHAGRGGLRGRGRAPRGPHRRLRPRRAGAGLGLDGCAHGHGRAPRPGRAPAQGPVRARAHLPARGGRLPAAQEPATGRICRFRRRRSSAGSTSSRRCSACSRARGC